jgi:hypothetical protein
MRRGEYTKEERAEALKIYEAGRANGLTAMDAAKEAGVPYITLRSWQLKRDERQEKLLKDIANIVAPSIEPVGLAEGTMDLYRNMEVSSYEAPAPTYPRLVLTSGNIVEGPLEGLIEILKAVEGRA